MISGSALLAALLYVVIGGLVWWVLWWGLSKIGLPQPFDKAARVILIVLACIFLISLLLSLTGHPIIRW